MHPRHAVLYQLPSRQSALLGSEAALESNLEHLEFDRQVEAPGTLQSQEALGEANLMHQQTGSLDTAVIAYKLEEPRPMRKARCRLPHCGAVEHEGVERCLRRGITQRHDWAG